MLSEILVLALISTNVFVLSQSTDVNIKPTKDKRGDKRQKTKDRPPPTLEYNSSTDSISEEQTTANWDDQKFGWLPIEQSSDENFTVDFKNVDPITDYSTAQESKSNGSSTFIWWFIAVIIVAIIGIGICWAYIAFDLSKDSGKVSDGKEQNKSDEDKKLDLKSDESAANQTVKSPKSADNLKNSMTSGQTNALQTNTKEKPKGAVTKECKPKLTSKIEPSKKTLSSI